MTRLKVLLIAPNCDGTDVGEGWWAYQWARALGKEVDVTLLAFQRSGRTPVAEQLPYVEVNTCAEPYWLTGCERLNAMLKPAYPLFYRWTRSWIRRSLREGRHFDLGHQLTPLALRYPSPFVGLGLPYIFGPLGGSLDTPPGFRAECGSAAWFTRLRQLDRLRLRWDTLLRRSYSEAALVFGVAPYVRPIMDSIPLKRFEVMSECGIDALAPASLRARSEPGCLKLLHVGRGVRTKGLRDVIRALALLPDFPGVTLDCAGQGEEMVLCQREAEKLGVGGRVRFHGQIPRCEVESLYAAADLFVFPSFREPSGSVVFEALRWGLPVIATDRGGPGHVVDNSCGVRVQVENPMQLANDLAAAIRNIAIQPQRLEALRRGASQRVEAIGIWPRKAAQMVSYYHELLDAKDKELAA